MTRRSVRAKAPGKINVYLGVGALRSDGFHDLATAFFSVNLFEFVEVMPTDDFSVSFHGPVSTDDLTTDDDNLAIRAAKALAKAGGIETGVSIRVEKHLPVAGGMAGGSADAAATLVACNELWGLDLGREGLLELGAELGADVPFSLMGGIAIGTGRGDVLSPALNRGSFEWVLVTPGGELSTPVVFNELDAHRWRTSRDTGITVIEPIVPAQVLQALRLGDAQMLAEAMHNDLQAPALKLHPRLVGVLELGERLGALSGLVSGSGPTCALLCEDADAAKQLVKALASHGIQGQRVTGPVSGAKVVE
ncbi:4-(cytidine 5'-diphospho)-2-C-methyl-D-erythritol kinase [uncultured Agrococcus sp.]|uniref:4-(cytidine 5'-diphospho)-2-C-methyl-D-erythritol kinase n=1 Tax=uncultured Agrococcus sp. TaxID=382258 RepID=UPI0025D7CF36|nr:4-(cytidine 5'-diphospho)-2-C-methyl-D-erythritol kinase [uncultured Agrococcus sp.]